MRGMNQSIALVAVMAAAMTTAALAQPRQGNPVRSENIYQAKEEGWFWYEREPEPPKEEKKPEPNGRAMNKALDMFNGQGRGADLSSAKDTAYGLLCSITEFVDHERRAMSTDHRLDSAWFGAGAGLKQRGLEQALSLIA